jgi:hypothetical protein
VPFERRMKCATIAIKRIGFGDVKISREILIFEAAVVLHANDTIIPASHSTIRTAIPMTSNCRTNR